MRLSQKEIRELPDGAQFKVIYSGSGWDKDFGKIYDVIKVENKLYHVIGFDEVDEIDDNSEDLDIIAIMK